MEYWGRVITMLATIITIAIAFAIFWFFKVRGEKKLPPEGVIKTRPPKALSGFFLGFAILVLVGGTAGIIYCCITDSENTTASIVVIFSLCVVVFSGIGFFGYAWVRFNYLVADNEGIYVYRLFRKERYYRYEEIGAFQDTIWQGMIGVLKGYDKNNKKIFAIEAVHIGATAIAQRLREHGIVERGGRYIKRK
ncbi:MAG: hypothetical protein K2J30_00885 [Clostridia bacterium]|nr:hypothetical protein [Clostridia bacterium]